MIQKTARFADLVGDLNDFLRDDQSSIKTAETQQASESAAPEGKSDPEVVSEMLPVGITVQGGSPGDLTTDKGAPTGTALPGQPSPPTEEPHKGLVSPDQKLAEANDPFFIIARELRSGLKVANEPACAASDPEVAEMIPGEGDTNAQTLDTSGNPEAKPGAGTNSSPGHEVKTAALSAAELDSLTQKVAQYMSDRQYGYSVASTLVENLFGIADDGQKTAAYGNPEVDRIHRSNLEFLEQRVNAKVAELVTKGYTNAQITAEIQKIAMEEGAEAVAGPEGMEGAPMEGAPMEGAPMEGGEGQPTEEQMVIVQALQELVEEGQITPEEAMQAAEEVDQMLAGGGEAPGGEMEAGGGAPPSGGGEEPSGPSGGESEGGDEEESEGGDEEESKKEAALRATPEYQRGLQIAGLINQKVAQISAGVPDGLRNAKIATLQMVDPTATHQEADAFLKAASVAAHSTGGNILMVKVASATPSVEESFRAVDHLIARGVITQKQAALALSELTHRNDPSKLAGILNAHNALVDFVNAKIAMDPSMGVAPDAGAAGPEAGAAPAPGGAPAPGPEGGAGDPGAAIEQLLGALEQLVALGVVPEDQAVAAVQGLGLIPPDGGAAPGGAPAPAGAGAPPAPMPPDPAAAGGAAVAPGGAV